MARSGSPILKWGGGFLLAFVGLLMLASMFAGGGAKPAPIQQRSTGELREMSLKFRGLVKPAYDRGDADLARRLRQAADALDDGQADLADTAGIDSLIVELRARGLL